LQTTSLVKALKQRQKELQNTSPFELAKMRDLSSSGKEGNGANNNNNNNSSTNNNNNNSHHNNNNNGRNGPAGTPSPPLLLPPGANVQCLPTSQAQQQHPQVNGPNSGNPPLVLGPNIHQVQQLIQQQLLTPSQLQSLMQHQSLFFQQHVSSLLGHSKKIEIKQIANHIKTCI